MKIYECKTILSIITLLMFLSAHFLIGMYFKSYELLMWIFSDIFLYGAILLQIIIILLIIRKEIEEVRKRDVDKN